MNRFHYLKFQNFDFFKVPYFCRINSGTIFYMSQRFLGLNHYKKKPCFYVHEKLQRNSSVGSCLKIFIFRPYGFDYLGFLTNACRGAMKSKPQWVFYKDLDWWLGPQKVQFREITRYPEVVGLILALLTLKDAGDGAESAHRLQIWRVFLQFSSKLLKFFFDESCLISAFTKNFFGKLTMLKVGPRGRCKRSSTLQTFHHSKKKYAPIS